MSKNAKDNTAALALALAVTAAAPAALAGGDHGGPHPISAPGGNASTGPVIVDAGGGAGGNASTGPVIVDAGGGAGGNASTGPVIVDGNNNGGNASSSSNSSSSANLSNSGNSSSDSRVTDSGNSSSTSRGGDQSQQQSNSGVNTLTDARVTRIKYNAAPNNTAPNVSGNADCVKVKSLGASFVNSLGVGYGTSKPDMNCIKTKEDATTDRAVTLKIIEQGGAIGTVYGMRKQAATSDAAADAFNGTTAAVKEYKVREDSKGPKREPSLSDLMSYGAGVERPSEREARIHGVQQRAAEHANRETGRDVRVTTPAPSFGGDR